MKTAYFIKYPRVIDDLKKPHLINQERPYEIVEQLVLAEIDYENFITDMRADRRFIEDAAEFCAEGDVIKCLYVRRRNKAGGILVVPENKSYVKWAAYLTEIPL